MKTKRKLKTWVKVFLLFLPVIVIICQLAVINSKLTKIVEQPTIIVIEESGVSYNG